MFANIGWVQLVVCLFIAILIFGTGRIKQAGHDLGGMIKGFRKEMDGEEIATLKDLNKARKAAKKVRKIL